MGQGSPRMVLSSGGPLATVPAMRGFMQRLWVWVPLCVTLLLLGAHGLLTLRLFGKTPAEVWRGLTDERPLLACRHGLHYSQGVRGAENWSVRHSVVGYDPAYYAGCPQTPWFATSSRPAELFAWLAGPDPAPYKIGVAVSWGLFPGLLWLSAVALGWSGHLRNFALTLTLLLAWSPWGLERFWAGDVALVLASGCLSLVVTLLPRCHDEPLLRNWLALFLAMALTLFWLPFMTVCVFPAVMLYYFFTGSHRPWSWHVTLGLAGAGAVLVNAPWLVALNDYWWLLGERMLPASPVAANHSLPWLTASLTVPLSARLLFLLLLGGGAFGLLRSRRGAPGSLLALLTAMVTAWGLAILGPMWEGCSALEPERFLFTTLLLAVVPSAQGLHGLCMWLPRFCSPRWWVGGLVLILVILELGLGLHRDVRQVLREGWRFPQLPLGFTLEQEACLARLQHHTTAEARILWEDIAPTEPWTPLLAVQTQRAYLGGLGTTGLIEHLRLRWAGGLLAGRPIHAWPTAEILEFCHRYNLGWVISHTPKGTQFWRQQPFARFVEQLPGGGNLFVLQRRPTWFLHGKGRITQCDASHMKLEDLEPQDGQVILSFHYHDRMMVTDHRVRLERTVAADGALPLLQLRLDAPIARVTIHW